MVLGSTSKVSFYPRPDPGPNESFDWDLFFTFKSEIPLILSTVPKPVYQPRNKTSVNTEDHMVLNL